MYRWLFVLVAILIPGQAHASRSSEVLNIAGAVRSFELTTTWRKPQAIVVALHPRPASGRAMRHIAGLDAHAEAASAVIVYPDALDGAWNAGGCCGEADDLGFVEGLLSHLRERLALPDVPAYVVGVSNGAAMAERLMLERPGLFSGGVLVSGAADAARIRETPPGQAVPTLVMIGRADAMLAGLEEAAVERSRRGGCSVTETTGDGQWDRRSEICEGTRLETWRLEAGHVWPGSSDSGPLSWPDAPFDAGEEALRFLGLLSRSPTAGS